MNGLIHIYTGDGKGKTTAALGLSLRASGCGMKVLIARFLKNDNSSEVTALKNIPNIELLPCEKSFGFFSRMSDEQKIEAKEYYHELLKDAIDRAVTQSFDMLVLDEIMAAYNYDLVDGKALLSFLKNKPVKLEIVMTGRDPADELKEIADYISEIKKIKHPFDQGITARTGIEM